jgi:UDP-N-acetyl-2-amino-2-deoxyglucuronate dehydrogenase
MSYGFGIVGLGLIADIQAQALAAAAGAELVACLSRSQSKADESGRRFGCSGFSEMADFLSQDGLDVVSICTPSGAHLEPALAAIDAGKHVIIEKPLEVTRERCDQILEAAARAGVVVAGIFPSRFLEVSRLMKEAISDGRLGRVVLGDAHIKWHRTQAYYDDGGWHGTRQLDGGGALMNQSIHAIDLLQWFMGPVETVLAATAILGHAGIEVEDTAVAALRFASGALGTIEGTTAAFPGFPKRLEVYGTRGSVISVQDRLEAWTFADEMPEDEAIRKRWSGAVGGGGASDPGAIGFQGHQAQFEDLVAALDDGRPPLVDGVEATRAVEIILAIYASARTGQPAAVTTRV